MHSGSTSTATSGSGTSQSATLTSISTKSTTSTSSSSSTKSTTLTTSTKSSTTTSSCATVATVAVTFNELVSTSYGQTIKISGNIAALGSWASSSAVALSPSQYTTANPLWFVTLNLAAGTVLQYKFINMGSSGTVTWEANPNRSYTVPSSCATAVTVSGSWQS